MDLLGISSAVSSAITKLIEIHRIDKWVKFFTQLGFSGVTSFLFTCGGAMAYPLRRPTLEAIGEGMVMAAVMMTVTWRNSELSKGLPVALPEAEAEKELQTSTEIINRK